jgi:hypothetical protein
MSGQDNGTTGKGTGKHGFTSSHGLTVTLGLFKDGLDGFITVIIYTYTDFVSILFLICLFYMQQKKKRKYEPLVMAIPKIPELKPLVKIEYVNTHKKIAFFF